MDHTLEMTLPSLGLLYEGALPDGVVRYHPMTAKEERLLAGGKGSIIDAVLESCLDLPSGFKSANLLINDRFFALMILRSTSYGEDYRFSVACPSCKAKFTHEVQLPGDFEVKILDDNTKEPFDVQLPISKKIVGFRLLRGDDELAIQRYADRAFQKGKVEGDPAYIYRVSRHVVEVDGEPIEGVKSMAFIESLIGRDSAALRNAIEAADFGMNIELTITCVRCDEDFELAMPMTTEFFRPRT